MRQLFAYLANGSTQVCLTFVIQVTKNDKRLTNIANKSLWRHLAVCYRSSFKRGSVLVLARLKLHRVPYLFFEIQLCPRL